MRRIVLLACALGVSLAAQEGFAPARYRSGRIPALPVTALGGGQVLLELAVSPTGRVVTVSPLRTTPPFTDLVVGAVRDWQFVPAEEGARPEPGRDQPPPRMPVPSTVLVAAVFRPPALTGPTLGETPRDVAAASGETAFPLTTTTPPFPPLAVSGGVVLLEVRVDSSGAVADATVLGAAPPFDGAALQAIRQWRFRPARVKGQAVSTFVYVVFGFPLPVTGAPPAAPATAR